MGNTQNPKIERSLKSDSGEDFQLQFHNNSSDSILSEFYRDQFVKKLAFECIQEDIPFSNSIYSKISDVKDRKSSECETLENNFLNQNISTMKIFSQFGNSGLKETELTNVLAKTITFANGFPLIGFTLIILTSGLFDDEYSKMKRHTNKIVRKIRNEIEFKIFEQSNNQFISQINSIKKSFESCERIIMEKNYSIEEIPRELKSIMIFTIGKCDEIYEKIKSKKTFYKFSYYFLENFYNFSIFHCSILITAVKHFGLEMYREEFSKYVFGYLNFFKDYVENAVKFRADCFTISKSNSTISDILRLITGSSLIEETLWDEFNSDELIKTEKTLIEGGSISSNNFSNLTKVYQKMVSKKKIFFDLEVIIKKIKENVSSILQEKLEFFVKKLEISLNHLQNQI